jgi:hypothetical protein
MLALLTDHLWQSLLCLLAGAVFAALLGNAAAQVRLWVWRIAGLKFLFPFALLHVLGDWLGFPVMHASMPAPPSLVALIADVRPWLSPAQTASLHGSAACAISALLLGISIAWSFWIVRQLRAEAALARWESCAAEDAPGMDAQPVGFLRAALLSLFVLCAVWAPAIAGAVDDRQRRHALIVQNSEALRNARVSMKIAAPGMGNRPRVIAEASGVLIRNVNIKELIAIAYGVSHYAVMGDQVTSRDTENPYDYWLISPRYDVRVTGPVIEPEEFAPYSLHLAITRLLAEKHGIEIHVNGRCQPPCGRWATRRPVPGS